MVSIVRYSHSSRLKINSVLNVKVLVGTLDQEKALLCDCEIFKNLRLKLYFEPPGEDHDQDARAHAERCVQAQPDQGEDDFDDDN